MKKYIVILFLFFAFLNSSFASSDFLVKKTTSWNDTYTNNLTNISRNSSLTFQITSIWWTTSRNMQINFPAWFVYESYSTSWNCGFTLNYNTNWNFGYSFSGSVNCISQVTFLYDTPNIAWNYSINLIENSTITNTVNIWVTWDNTIIKAYSIDKNNNWYIDGYEIYFADNTLNSNVTWLKVWDENIISYVWNSSSWIINFADNIFNTWELPQITSNGITFWNVWIIWNTSIIEEDKAKPILLNINSWNNITWTDNLILNFSEMLNINKSDFSKYVLRDKNNSLVNFVWTYSNTGKTFTINPTSTLYSDKNPFSIFINDIEDWNQNKLNTNTNFSIVQNICSIPSVSNWSVSAFPGCVITCNSWYTKSGNSCIANSGGWGGWGWGWGWGSFSKTCTDSDLVCSLHNWSYIWLRKSWVVCDWWNLAKTCSISQTWTWSENITSSWSENIETWSWNIIDNNWWGINKEILKLDEVKTYLLLNVNKWLHKLVNQLYTMINYEFINYFVLVNNNTSNNYQELLLNYKELFININNYLSLKNKNYLLNARENYINFNKYYNITKNLENKYITKVTKNGDTIFETKVEKLKIPLNKIEKIIIWKYKNLLSSYTITKTEYNDAIKNYNNFVLYLSIYRIDKTSEAKKRWKEYLTLVIKTYNIKIKKDIVINNTIKEDSKTLVKDIYNFSKDLKFWDYNDDVRNLQLLLKHYNYFPFEATWYFWSWTKEYLEKFCYEVLWIEFMWILNLEIREKILNLEY